MNFERILQIFQSKKPGKLNFKLTQAAKDELFSIAPQFKTTSEVLWAAFNKIEIRPICETCKGEVNFRSPTKGFFKTCSLNCGANSPITKAKTKATQEGKYGGHHTRTDEYKAKILEKYGEIPGNYGSIAFKNAMLDKYGVDNFFKRTDLMKEAYIAKLGVDNPLKHPDILARVMVTNQERYGGNSPACSYEVQRKMSEAGTKLHEFKFPSGKIAMVQGY
jgi:hypothetical protein